MTTTNDLLAELVAARKAAGLSQADLAKRLATTQTGLSYWESGQRSVTLANFVRWAQALGLDVAVVSRVESPLPELYAGGLA